jgi:hypothetical protein
VYLEVTQRSDGSKFLVNFDHVFMITPDGEEGCTLWYGDEDGVELADKYEEACQWFNRRV